MKIKILPALIVLPALLASFSVAARAQSSLSLDEAVAIALNNSRVLNIAREGTIGAKAGKHEAITRFLPKLSTSYSYVRLNEAPGLNFPGFPPVIPPAAIVTGTKDNYNWVIEARQPLFAGGGILAAYQSSQIAEDAAVIEEAAKAQDVIYDVKVAYFNILRAQRLCDTADRAVEMLSAHCDAAEHFFKVGLIPKNDLLQAQVELANGRQAAVKAQNALELAGSHLNILLKRDLHTPVEVQDNLFYAPFDHTLEQCLDIARQNRPELKAAKLKSEQANKAVRIAMSEFFPVVSLVGQYGRFGDKPDLDGSTYRDAENWQVMAVASWDFWEWGKSKYRVDASRAALHQATDMALELHDQVALEIKNAYLLLKEAQSQIDVSQKVIDQARENHRISEARYLERVARSTEVLDAQTLFTRARSEYANALADYNISQARLERAMGIINRPSQN